MLEGGKNVLLFQVIFDSVIKTIVNICHCKISESITEACSFICILEARLSLFFHIVLCIYRPAAQN